MARKNRKGNDSVRVDLSDFEVRKRITEEGDYPLRVVEVVKEKGEKGDYLSWKFQVIDGDSEGAAVYYNTSMSKASLWNLRGLLEALEVEIPDEEFDLDLSEMVDLEMTGVIVMGEYNNKPRAELVDFSPLSKKKKGKKDKDEDKGDKKKKGKKDKDEDEADKVPAGEVEDADEKALKKLVKKHELEVDLEEAGSLKKQRKAVLEALEEAGLLEEDEEEEEDDKDEKKKKGKKDKDKKGKGKDKKIDQDEVMEMDEDALTKLVEEHDLELDLDDYRSLSKKRNAVIDKLEEGDLLKA
jgi:hypothetical protein